MAPPNPPRALPPCELCGGVQVGNLNVVSQQLIGVHPNGQSLWVQPLSTLRAVTCLHCGHTKLFAAELPKIRQTAEKHPERFTW